MIAETQKAPEGAYCAPALRRSIFRLRAKDGWIISTLTLKSSLRFLPCPAVKAHDKLTLEEIEKLVVDLAHAEMPYTCPHGRPTVIFMGFNELNRKFGRA